MSVWVDIKFAPKDGKPVDLWVVKDGRGRRLADCVWIAIGDGDWFSPYVITGGSFLLSEYEGIPTHYMPIQPGPT